MSGTEHAGPSPLADDPLVPIPLAILSGFLGAGKTTRLNQWLKNAAFSDTLVIINEFGDVGLDHLLIEEAPGDIIVMPAGCLCCSIRGDLIATLEDLLRRRDNHRIRFFRRLVIETTGLADPLPILHAVLQHPYLSKRFVISGILTLVDAINGAQTLEKHPEAARQVALADAIILTKTDIASPTQCAATEAEIRRINPNAPRLSPDEAAEPHQLLAHRFDAARLDEASLIRWLGPGIAKNTSADLPHVGKGIETFAILSSDSVSVAQLTVFREAMRILHGPRILRMKGIVAIKETPEQPIVIHQVQSSLHPAVTLPAWPSRDRRTRLVFITEGIERANIEAFWQALSKSV